MRRESRVEGYTQLPHRIIISDRMLQVSDKARLLFIVMLGRWRGGKKPFEYTYKDMGVDTGYRNDRLAVLLKELYRIGVVEKVEAGGLECNKNQYAIDTDWMALRRRGIEPAAPKNWTEGEVSSLAVVSEKDGVVCEAAVLVDLDTEKLFNQVE